MTEIDNRKLCRDCKYCPCFNSDLETACEDFELVTIADYYNEFLRSMLKDSTEAVK